jgi:tetratricopeptide (TPR) repeat protein
MEPTTVEQLPLSHKAWAWFEANKKPTLWGAGALVLAAAVVSYVMYHQDQQAIAAGEALSSVSVPQMGGAGNRAGAAEAYLKVAAEYPNSQAGARALLLAAGTYFKDGKYAEARTQFERFRREHADSPFVGEALLGMAACLDAQGSAKEAIAGYKDLIERRSADYVLPQARFSLARLYEAQNQPELARNLYEEVEHSDPYGSLGSEAGMRLEELKEKYPKLFAPATNAPPSNFLPIKGGTAVTPAPAKSTGTNTIVPVPAQKH